VFSLVVYLSRREHCIDIVLVDDSILKKFSGFSSPRRFSRINFVYAVNGFSNAYAKLLL